MSKTVVDSVMHKLNRQVRPEDLRNKGFPFECQNCGNKPLPQQVIDFHGDCEICGDTIVAYTIDVAEMIVKLLKEYEQNEKTPN